MSSHARDLLFIFLTISFFLTLDIPFAQAQALNGQIEGSISDEVGSVIAHADVKATHFETGASRSTTSDANGIYRFPLLPLGTWRIIASAPGFKQLARDGVKLEAGQTTTIDLKLQAGDVSESVTVTGDAPVTDTGKTDLGRVLDDREVHNIPLPTRNPYNFVILQANVTGRLGRGFNFPQVNVNGFARRVNYQLEGNVNTQPETAGARLMTMSEVYVGEIQIVTNGFAPEFGNTTGMIMNIITPSGTNEFSGSVAYLFRRPSFYSRPFFFSAARLPDNVTNNLTATVGGPIVKNRWHFYLGYEVIQRDDSTRSNRQVTISEANKTALIAEGLPASIFVPAFPGKERGNLFIFRSDAQLNSNNSLMARFNRGDVVTENAIAGNITTLERGIDIAEKDYSIGVQLVSFTQQLLNEMRFQHAHRFSYSKRNEYSGSGPSITIPGVANFGSPTDSDTISPLMDVTQVQDNFTRTSGSHAIKFGGGFSLIQSKSRKARFALYTFPSIAAYRSARLGVLPQNYTRYDESFGDPDTNYKATYWNLFAQDDWKATRRLKFNYGVRYDLYVIPKADVSAMFPASRQFKIDKNNVAPRFGFVYALREGSRPLVIRAGAGIYFEPPLLAMYVRALLENGAPKFFSIRFCGEAGGSTCPYNPLAPLFPNTFSGSQHAGSTVSQQKVITVSEDFVNMYAIHSNIQIEQSLTDDLSIAVGYVHSGGRQIPVYRNINPINPVGYLADGRPRFSPNVNSATRRDPRFDVIEMAESVGVSQYDGLAIQLRQRVSRGIQFSANYTFSKATDDAPEQNVPYMFGGGAITSFALSDPTNRALDKGYSYGDQRHTFVMSMVAQPNFGVSNGTLRSILNNNQFGIIATANSGERFSIGAGVLNASGSIAPLDLNIDGLSILSDRPVGIKRNSGKTPPQFNLDLRYSRFFNLTERYKLEIYLEVQNLFNLNNIVAYTNTLVQTDTVTGMIIGPIPDFKARNSSTALESRQAQVGIKFHF